MRIQESGIILFTENYETAVDFYAAHMGLHVRERQINLTVFDFGGSYLMVERGGVGSSAEKSRAQNPTVLRFDVIDFEQAVQELLDRRVTVDVHIHSWGTIGVIIDPEGNRIELKKA
jgi:lactoylglutathione lyase